MVHHEVIFMIASHQNIHHIPCSYSALKKVIQKDFFALLSWVKKRFDFGFSAIDIKGLIKRVIDEQILEKNHQASEVSLYLNVLKT